MNNEPVVWKKLTDDDRIEILNSMPDYLDGFLKTWGWLNFSKATEEKIIEKNFHLISHPVKEQSNLVNVVKNHIEDLVKCVKLFRSYEMDNTADEMEVAIKELEIALEAHPVKELTAQIVSDVLLYIENRKFDLPDFLIEEIKNNYGVKSDAEQD